MGKNDLGLYSEYADWFHLLTAPGDYAEEAAVYTGLIESAGDGLVQTVLELGSGGGNNASHMKDRFALTLTDISPDMLAISRALNPECEHIEGDMRTLRLGRAFDAVFAHDALDYLVSLSDVARAIETAWVHCRPGGVALFTPDCLVETFRPASEHGGHDGQGRALRYLEWSWDPDPDDGRYNSEMVYLMRDECGHVTCQHERHVLGLFRRADWLELLARQGFVARAVPYELTEIEDGNLEAFVAVKPRD